MALRKPFVVSAALLLLIIAALSFLPTPLKAALHTKGRLHDAGHAIAFGAITFLLAASTRSTALKGQMLLGVIAVGFALEFAQHIVYPGEVFELQDVIFDAGGAIFGLLLAPSSPAPRPVARPPQQSGRDTPLPNASPDPTEAEKPSA